MTDESTQPANVTPISAGRGSVATSAATPAAPEPVAPATLADGLLATPVISVPAATELDSPLPAARKVMPAAPAPVRPRESRRDLSVRLSRAVAQTIPIVYYRLVRLGPAGIAGLAAMLVAAAIGVTALVGVRSATDALDRQIAQMRQRPKLATGDDLAIAKVLAQLPTRGQIPGVIGQMLGEARQAGVALDVGHYSYSPPRGGGVGRYELEFPVKAEYVSVRDFINRTLLAVPSAGLDKLHIERKAVGDTLVSADVRFVVFVRSEAQE